MSHSRVFTGVAWPEVTLARVIIAAATIAALAAIAWSSRRAWGQIASGGASDTCTPACASCHGPDKMGQNTAYPKLAGQHASYLEDSSAFGRKSMTAAAEAPSPGSCAKSPLA